MNFHQINLKLLKLEDPRMVAENSEKRGEEDSVMEKKEMKEERETHLLLSFSMVKVNNDTWLDLIGY